MTDPREPAAQPMAEPGKHPQGSGTGGMRSTADAGLSDAAQRSAERSEAATPTPVAPAAGAPGTASKPADGSSGSAKRKDASWNDDEGEDWRHAPVAPSDENPLESLGRSVSEAVTGTDDTPAKTKPAGRP